MSLVNNERLGYFAEKVLKRITDVNKSTSDTLSEDITSKYNELSEAITSGDNTLDEKIEALRDDVDELLENVQGNVTQQINDLSDAFETFTTNYNSRPLYEYKGTLNSYNDLPTEGMKNGDTYNIKRSNKSKGIKAGDNVAWNGSEWDNLSGGEELDYLTIAEVGEWFE